MDETTIRLGASIAIFAIMALLQAAWPRRKLTLRYRRWPGNLGIVVIDILIVRLLFPAGAVGAALWADANQIGLLQLTALPDPIAIIIAVILLDLLIYWQHRIFHRIPLLWRLHRVHHADHEIDVSTGLRFHPLEIVISMLLKILFVITLGIPVIAVIIFEVILNGMAMFNHANVKLPLKLDATLRLIFITPDVHRIHHSVIKHETDSNFGFNLSVWDRMFRSWRAEPERGHEQMQIGLSETAHDATWQLGYMLRLPFAADSAQYGNQDSREGPRDV